MSLLDELRKQAEDIRQHGEDTPESRREKLYNSRLKPRLQDIHHYLIELKAQLDVVKLDVRHDYELPAVGVVTQLLQGAYVVTTDSADQTKTVRMRFTCTADKNIKFEVTQRAEADTAQDFFRSQRMQFSEWGIRDANGRITGANFDVRVKIDILFIFQADLDEQCIRLTVSNFDQIGVERYTYKPEEIDAQWLDDLGNLILRRHQHLNSLEISDSEREGIKRLVETDKRARQEELNRQRELEQQSPDAQRTESSLARKIRRIIES